MRLAIIKRGLVQKVDIKKPCPQRAWLWGAKPGESVIRRRSNIRCNASRRSNHATHNNGCRYGRRCASNTCSRRNRSRSAGTGGCGTGSGPRCRCATRCTTRGTRCATRGKLSQHTSRRKGNSSSNKKVPQHHFMFSKK